MDSRNHVPTRLDLEPKITSPVPLLKAAQNYLADILDIKWTVTVFAQDKHMA